MPVTINTDLFAIIGVLFGLVGIILAAYQTVSARRVKQIYQNHCRSRCKDIVALTKALSEEVIDACRAIERDVLGGLEEIDRPGRLPLLAAKLNAIRVLTARLATYCEHVNEEYTEQYKQPIFANMREAIPHMECLSKTLRSEAPPETHRPTDAV